MSRNTSTRPNLLASKADSAALTRQRWNKLSCKPFNAIRKSAHLLRGLWTQFGSLGLGAAAYNAGPKPASHWLARYHKDSGITVHDPEKGCRVNCLLNPR